MDEGVTPPSSPKTRNDTKIFEECFPFYLSIGMSYDEYWNGPNDAPKFYRKAYKMKQEQINHEAWLYGLYVYDATISALTHLSPKKDSHESYASRPYSFDTKKTQEEKKVEAEAQAEMWMKSWVQATQKMFENK